MKAIPIKQVLQVRLASSDPRFDGMGAVSGGGATAVLLKDYPEPQRSQILDLVFKPKFGASVSAMLVEIPGDGNSTQGSMPSHQHDREDLSSHRGYIWWILREAKRRNPAITLDAVAWSAPGWIGDGEFWSQDMADYYVSWLRLLREEHELELDAIGCRNEKGVSFEFVKMLRASLNTSGFPKVLIHAFDNWPEWKFDFVAALDSDAEARDAVAVIGAHVMHGDANSPAPREIQEWAAAAGKPIWNTEDHVYREGFDCLIGIVKCLNDNFIVSGATKVILWYDIAGVYPVQPYAVGPAMILSHEPWSGHYAVREALWAYAHYGQFTAAGWHYVRSACTALAAGGSVVTMRSPEGGDISSIIETQGATGSQRLRIDLPPCVHTTELCVWRSDVCTQFVALEPIAIVDGAIELDLLPDAVYSISTTTGQRKGVFEDIPQSGRFPFPYRDDFGAVREPAARGSLPRYTADISGAFELVERPGGKGCVLRQAAPRPTISWAPDWQPFTILGDLEWQDYEVRTRLLLGAAGTAGVMGRVHHVGTGFGFMPKGYYFCLDSTGGCRLLSANGKDDKFELVGDAEQQATIRQSDDRDPGGVLELARADLPGFDATQWHDVTLRLDGDVIEAIVDGRIVVTVHDARHARGMAGLLAGASTTRLSKPSFDNIRIVAVRADEPALNAYAAHVLYPEIDGGKDL